MENREYTQAESTCSLSYIFPSDLRKGSIVIMRNRPAKVVEYTSIVNGKHGTSKTIVTALDIFNGHKYETSWNSGDRIPTCEVKKQNYTVIDVEDEYMSLMDEHGHIRYDFKVPENIQWKDKITNTEGATVQMTTCFNIEDITHVI